MSDLMCWESFRHQGGAWVWQPSMTKLFSMVGLGLKARNLALSRCVSIVDFKMLISQLSICR